MRSKRAAPATPIPASAPALAAACSGAQGCPRHAMRKAKSKVVRRENLPSASVSAQKVAEHVVRRFVESFQVPDLDVLFDGEIGNLGKETTWIARPHAQTIGRALDRHDVFQR